MKREGGEAERKGLSEGSVPPTEEISRQQWDRRSPETHTSDSATIHRGRGLKEKSRSTGEKKSMSAENGRSASSYGGPPPLYRKWATIPREKLGQRKKKGSAKSPDFLRFNRARGRRKPGRRYTSPATRTKNDASL